MRIVPKTQNQKITCVKLGIGVLAENEGEKKDGECGPHFCATLQVTGDVSLKLGVFSCAAEMYDENGVEPLFVTSNNPRYNFAPCAPELVMSSRCVLVVGRRTLPTSHIYTHAHTHPSLD